MGCSASGGKQQESSAPPAYAQNPYQQQPAAQDQQGPDHAPEPAQYVPPPPGPAQHNPQQFGWGAAGNQVRIQAPNQNDPPFMQTVAPSGTTWGQYVRTGSSFVNPMNGFLSGPWAECVAWAVIFEHSNDWESMPQYADDGVVGGVLTALEESLEGRPNKDEIMAAAQRLEDASHALAERGEPLPAIHQVVTVPSNATPGQPVKIENPQTPGTYMTVNVPPNAQPGQQIVAQTPVQPAKTGGFSTGGKIALAAGGAVAAGALAAGVYYGTVGGGAEGFMGDMGAAGDWAGDAVGDAGGALGEAGDAIGDAVGGVDFEGFAGDAGDVVGEFGGEAIEWMGGAGDMLADLF
mmetsp:Transcript_46674/g.131865  ORF Transcript_46674/g.131865 Transcript_46674/m.131865 type:complete len:349 (-) Transcript_46674:139-1185(-)